MSRASDSQARPCQRHEPEKALSYQIVSEHLETFLDEVRDNYDKPLPAYVEKELREFLKCGLLPHRFLRARCKKCGRELFVALSCKRRGVCCSCSARRMGGTAAHLTDNVIPDVPLRQWVISVHCSWRSQVVARTEGCRHGQHARCASARRATSESCDRPVAELGRGQCRGSGPSRGQGERCSNQRALTAIGPVPAPVPASGRAERVCRPAPDTPVHCAPQALRAASSRIPWAELLKRAYSVNALACPCGGRLEFISLILEPEVAREILQSLHLPSELPPVARARSPDPRDELPVEW